MENFENLSENLKVSPKKFSLSFDFIDVTPCLAYVRGNQHEAGCHVMKSNESRKLLRRNFEVFLKFSKFSIQQVGERFNKECQPQAGGSTLNCHRLNNDEIKTKSAAVAAVATAAVKDEDEGYMGSLINSESQLKMAKACTVAAARPSNIDHSDPYVDCDYAASQRKRQSFRLCSAEGCTNQARAAGVCWSHGAKPPPILNVNLCSSGRAALTPTAALKNEEDPGPSALINKESRLKKAKACAVAAARPSNIYGSVPYHVLVDEAYQRKRQHSGSVGEDIVPKKTARMQHRKWSTTTEDCTNQARDGGMRVRYGAKVKPKKCSSEGCTNRVVQGGVCTKHGAKIKQCSFEGCTNLAQNGGICKRHGAKVKRCSSEGCTNQARSGGGVCLRHGAKVKHKRCSSEGCTNQVVQGGVCTKHGAKAKIKRCSFEGCTNLARNGGVCKRHGAKVKKCISEGCTNPVVQGGVCTKHGAKIKRCSFEGCTNLARNGGVCKRHGAKVKLCINDGCTNQARARGGVCLRHGAKVKQCSSEGCTK
ncbi:hypothetical protein QTG54_005562 [Skeletonema marinoi]|uniref:WRKY19-like zinc finger domain-containing protein n=1 Tax=Skeletonema marinoi TaxID=267567 RepID=A0AAD8YEG8_9STRA|nr:hypothetical protein QTG54_005562 [Skeletonema marinoi]